MWWIFVTKAFNLIRFVIRNFWNVGPAYILYVHLLLQSIFFFFIIFVCHLNMFWNTTSIFSTANDETHRQILIKKAEYWTEVGSFNVSTTHHLKFMGIFIEFDIFWDFFYFILLQLRTWQICIHNHEHEVWLHWIHKFICNAEQPQNPWGFNESFLASSFETLIFICSIKIYEFNRSSQAHRQNRWNQNIDILSKKMCKYFIHGKDKIGIKALFR